MILFAKLKVHSTRFSITCLTTLRTRSTILPRSQGSTDTVLAPSSHTCRKALGLDRGPAADSQIHQHHQVKRLREKSCNTKEDAKDAPEHSFLRSGPSSALKESCFVFSDCNYIPVDLFHVLSRCSSYI